MSMKKISEVEQLTPDAEFENGIQENDASIKLNLVSHSEIEQMADDDEFEAQG